jgi:hypothetical protein
MSLILDVERPRQSGRFASNWPKITVVTPSHNQGRFLERAIRSVLSQDYPNLEYFVFDAGSTDNSLAILKKYDKRLTYWISQPDGGQSDAITKGWNMATGDVLAWLNSDDFYYPGALHEVGRIFSNDPKLRMLCGSVAHVDENEQTLRVKQPVPVAPEVLLPRADLPPQVGTFLRREVFDQLGGPRLDLHYVMDWELWLRVSLNYPTTAIAFSNEVLAADRQWSGTKTLNAAGRDAAEGRKVLQELFGSERLSPQLRALERVALARSWWRQSKSELRSGLRRAALLSLGNAVRLSAASFPALKVLRQFKRILFYQKGTGLKIGSTSKGCVAQNISSDCVDLR